MSHQPKPKFGKVPGAGPKQSPSPEPAATGTEVARVADQGSQRRSNGQFAPGNEGAKNQSPATKERAKRQQKKTMRIKGALEELMDQGAIRLDGTDITGPNGEKLTFEEAIALSLATKAASGDKDAQKEVLDRLLGKAPQSIDLNATQHIETTERVSDIARQRINSTAREAASGGGSTEVSQLRSHLDVSQDGDRSSEDAGSEHSVAGEASSAG